MLNFIDEEGRLEAIRALYYAYRRYRNKSMEEVCEIFKITTMRHPVRREGGWVSPLPLQCR